MKKDIRKFDDEVDRLVIVYDFHDIYSVWMSIKGHNVISNVHLVLFIS